MEKIRIDPLEELLKGIEVVHGKAYADNCRNAAAHLMSPVDPRLNGPGTPIWRLTKLAEWTENVFDGARCDSAGFESVLIKNVEALQEEVLNYHETFAKVCEMINAPNDTNVIEAVAMLLIDKKKLEGEIRKLKRRKK